MAITLRSRPLGAQAGVTSRAPGASWLWPFIAVLVLSPVAAGLIGTALPAFGFFPPLGGRDFSLAPWRTLLEVPGLKDSMRLSVGCGLATTAVSLLVVVGFCAAFQGTRILRQLEGLLAPLLSVPHVAVAFGIAFLVAPSGWILRLLSPWATGFQQPPDWLIVHDRHGITLILGLIAKEVPFLFAMTLAAMGQADAERCHVAARMLGYGRLAGWMKGVFPRIYPQIRLPVLAVLAYGISVVDVAIVLGPTTPAPLAVRLVRWFQDADLDQRFMASAGALLQVGLVLAGMILWRILEWLTARLGRKWIQSGLRHTRDRALRTAAALAVAGTSGIVLAAIAGMVVWSMAKTWRFPDAVPSGLTFSNWTRHASDIVAPVRHTLSVAIGSTLAALVLSIGLLEREARSGRRVFGGFSGFLYLPLLVPQVAFLLGTQTLLVTVGMDGTWIALTWIHLVFVFPYVFLALADAYRAWDDRYFRTGLCLGVRPARVFLRVKLPMLLRPAAAAGAVGFAVSVGQYLPTLFAGSGRFPTLTTEAVTLSAGGDQRWIGIYAILQMTLPLAGFALAVFVPRWIFRRHRSLQITP